MRKSLYFGWLLAFAALLLPCPTQAADNWDDGWAYFEVDNEAEADEAESPPPVCAYGVDHFGSPCWCLPAAPAGEDVPGEPIICGNPFENDEAFLNNFQAKLNDYHSFSDTISIVPNRGRCDSPPYTPPPFPPSPPRFREPPRVPPISLSDFLRPGSDSTFTGSLSASGGSANSGGISGSASLGVGVNVRDNVAIGVGTWGSGNSNSGIASWGFLVGGSISFSPPPVSFDIKSSLSILRPGSEAGYLPAALISQSLVLDLTEFEFDEEIAFVGVFAHVYTYHGGNIYFASESEEVLCSVDDPNADVNVLYPIPDTGNVMVYVQFYLNAYRANGTLFSETDVPVECSFNFTD